MTKAARWICIVGMMTGIGVAVAATPKVAPTRTAALGTVNDVSPTGDASGGPSDVKFQMRASFAGVNGETHIVTAKLTVVDATGTVLVNKSESHTLTSGEQGCILCPVSETIPGVKPGGYIVQGVLVDESDTPQRPNRILDVRAGQFNLN